MLNDVDPVVVDLVLLAVVVLVLFAMPQVPERVVLLIVVIAIGGLVIYSAALDR
jgi:hypothetical protein